MLRVKGADGLFCIAGVDSSSTLNEYSGIQVYSIPPCLCFPVCLFRAPVENRIHARSSDCEMTHIDLPNADASNPTCDLHSFACPNGHANAHVFHPEFADF